MPRTFPPFTFGPVAAGDESPEETNATFEDYEAVGRKLVEWANGNPADWPKNPDELRAALGNHLWISSKVKRLQVVQSDDSDPNDVLFILRLPAKGQLNESNQLAAQNSYNLPPVIDMLSNRVNETGAAIAATQVNGTQVGQTQRMFHARVADYTMRQCR